MQEKAQRTKSCKAEYLRRFLDLSLRQNYPLTSLVKNSFDKEATLSVFHSYCANTQEPTIEEAENFLEGPGNWLKCSASDLLALCQETSTYKKFSLLFGSILQELIEKRQWQEAERLRLKAFEGERRALENSFVNQAEDKGFMGEALKQAELALNRNEVPIGAVVVIDRTIIGRGFNNTVGRNDPTSHAEILAIREASLKVDNYRLTEATLYVTLEPCPMCAGAILNSRIKRVVYGVSADEQNRVCGSKFLLEPKKPTDRPFVTSGVLKEECMGLLKGFFADKRLDPRDKYDIKES